MADEILDPAAGGARAPRPTPEGIVPVQAEGAQAVFRFQPPAPGAESGGPVQAPGAQAVFRFKPSPQPTTTAAQEAASYDAAIEEHGLGTKDLTQDLTTRPFGDVDPQLAELLGDDLPERIKVLQEENLGELVDKVDFDWLRKDLEQRLWRRELASLRAVGKNPMGLSQGERIDMVERVKRTAEYHAARKLNQESIGPQAMDPLRGLTKQADTELLAGEGLLPEGRGNIAGKARELQDITLEATEGLVEGDSLVRKALDWAAPGLVSDEGAFGQIPEAIRNPSPLFMGMDYKMPLRQYAAMAYPYSGYEVGRWNLLTKVAQDFFTPVVAVQDVARKIMEEQPELSHSDAVALAMKDPRSVQPIRENKATFDYALEDHVRFTTSPLWLSMRLLHGGNVYDTLMEAADVDLRAATRGADAAPLALLSGAVPFVGPQIAGKVLGEQLFSPSEEPSEVQDFFGALGVAMLAPDLLVGGAAALKGAWSGAKGLSNASRAGRMEKASGVLDKLQKALAEAGDTASEAAAIKAAIEELRFFPEARAGVMDRIGHALDAQQQNHWRAALERLSKNAERAQTKLDKLMGAYRGMDSLPPGAAKQAASLELAAAQQKHAALRIFEALIEDSVRAGKTAGTLASGAKVDTVKAMAAVSDYATSSKRLEAATRELYAKGTPEAKAAVQTALAEFNAATRTMAATNAGYVSRALELGLQSARAARSGAAAELTKLDGGLAGKGWAPAEVVAAREAHEAGITKLMETPKNVDAARRATAQLQATVQGMADSFRKSADIVRNGGKVEKSAAYVVEVAPLKGADAVEQLEGLRRIFGEKPFTALAGDKNVARLLQGHQLGDVELFNAARRLSSLAGADPFSAWSLAIEAERRTLHRLFGEQAIVKATELVEQTLRRADKWALLKKFGTGSDDLLNIMRKGEANGKLGVGELSEAILQARKLGAEAPELQGPLLAREGFHKQLDAVFDKIGATPAEQEAIKAAMDSVAASHAQEAGIQADDVFKQWGVRWAQEFKPTPGQKPLFQEGESVLDEARRLAGPRTKIPSPEFVAEVRRMRNAELEISRGEDYYTWLEGVDEAALVERMGSDLLRRLSGVPKRLRDYAYSRLLPEKLARDLAALGGDYDEFLEVFAQGLSMSDAQRQLVRAVRHYSEWTEMSKETVQALKKAGLLAEVEKELKGFTLTADPDSWAGVFTYKGKTHAAGGVEMGDLVADILEDIVVQMPKGTSSQFRLDLFEYARGRALENTLDGAYQAAFAEQFADAAAVFAQKAGTKVRGAAWKTPGGAMAEVYKTGDIGTLAHELGHIIRLTTPDPGPSLKVIYDTFGDGAKITRKGEEAFADAFMKYMEGQYRPQGFIEKSFRYLKDAWLSFWGKVRGKTGAEVPPQARRLFDKWLSLKPKPSPTAGAPGNRVLQTVDAFVEGIEYGGTSLFRSGGMEPPIVEWVRAMRMLGPDEARRTSAFQAVSNAYVKDGEVAGQALEASQARLLELVFDHAKDPSSYRMDDLAKAALEPLGRVGHMDLKGRAYAATGIVNGASMWRSFEDIAFKISGHGHEALKTALQLTTSKSQKVVKGDVAKASAALREMGIDPRALRDVLGTAQKQDKLTLVQLGHKNLDEFVLDAFVPRNFIQTMDSQIARMVKTGDPQAAKQPWLLSNPVARNLQLTMLLWRRGITSGLLSPRAAHFINNFLGLYAQTWMSAGFNEALRSAVAGGDVIHWAHARPLFTGSAPVDRRILRTMRNMAQELKTDKVLPPPQIGFMNGAVAGIFDDAIMPASQRFESATGEVITKQRLIDEMVKEGVLQSFADTHLIRNKDVAVALGVKQYEGFMGRLEQSLSAAEKHTER